MKVELLDTEMRFPHPGVRSRYRYAAVFGAGPYRLRVRLNLETIRRESSAVVEVLSGSLTWTWLIDAEPPEHVPGEFDQSRVDDIATRLVARALAILPEVAGVER